MSRIIRILAVIALALSPVWGYQADVAASGLSSPARYPVWPSFSSTGCSALQGPGGSTSVSCGQGSFLLSQVAIGYTCNQLDISVSSFQSGSFLVVGTALDGTQNNTLTIDGTGNYFMQFPQPLVQNLVTLQMTAGGSGAVMTVQSITGSPCAVASSTPTINPSFTPTDTAVPVTGTPTPIATHTPLPSGHSTFTPTVTPTGTVGSATPTLTATASPTPGIVVRNCGDVTFPLLNCDYGGGTAGPGTSNGTAPLYWTLGGTSGPPFFSCFFRDAGAQSVIWNGQGTTKVACTQDVVAGATGNVFMSYQANGASTGGSVHWQAAISGNTPATLDPSSCSTVNGTGPFCTVELGPVVAGSTYNLGTFYLTCNLGNTCGWFGYIADTWVGTSSGTATPGPTNTVTGTPTSTATFAPETATAVAGLTETAIASSATPTSIPVPGAMSTAIATSTECPGGCAVAALTNVPSIATRITVDTSPFSPFTSLSLARSDCKPFGYVQIPYPVIHGTPALGSSIPLSVTWTAPVTHDWDNSNPYSNTAIQPCAMDVINYIDGAPTHIWDLTYWLSVLAIAIVFIMWLIGFVGRLSGDETING